MTRVHARLKRLAHRPRVRLWARAVPPGRARSSVLALARRAVAARLRLRLAAEPGRTLAPVPVRPAAGALNARPFVVRAGDASAGGTAPSAPGRADARVPQPDGSAPRVARRERLLRQPRRQMRRRLQRTRRRLEQGHALRVPRRVYRPSVAPRAPVLAQTLAHHRALFQTHRSGFAGGASFSKFFVFEEEDEADGSRSGLGGGRFGRSGERGAARRRRLALSLCVAAAREGPRPETGARAPDTSRALSASPPRISARAARRSRCRPTGARRNVRNGARPGLVARARAEDEEKIRRPSAGVVSPTASARPSARTSLHCALVMSAEPATYPVTLSVYDCSCASTRGRSSAVSAAVHTAAAIARRAISPAGTASRHRPGVVGAMPRRGRFLASKADRRLPSRFYR